MGWCGALFPLSVEEWSQLAASGDEVNVGCFGGGRE